MRLTELNPILIKYKGRRGVGVRFYCPVCRGCQIAVLFLNPLDGGPSVPNDPEALGNNGGCRWARSGMTFEDMTLSPSVDVSKAGSPPCTEGGPSHWHGFMTDGEIS